MVKKLTSVNLADIKTNLFVRRSLDEDRVGFFAELIESGVQIDPMQVATPSMEMIDGRHRKEGYELNDITAVEVELVHVENEVELIAMAFRANSDGALPPTTSDIEHTIEALLDRGATKKSIGELLKLPTSLARKYINNIESRLKRQKLQRAAMAVAEGDTTVAAAAEQFGVDIDQLKDMVSGGKRKRKKSGVEETKRTLSNAYRSIGSKNAGLLRNLFDKLDDGDITPKFALEVLKHVEHLQKNQSKTIANWRSRLEAKINGGAK